MVDILRPHSDQVTDTDTTEVERLRGQIEVIGSALAHMVLGVRPAGEPQPVDQSVEAILGQTIGDEPLLDDDVHQLLASGARDLIDARIQEAGNV